MKKMMLLSVCAVIGFAGCTSPDKPAQQAQTVINTKHAMKNLVSIIEIPAADLKRAIRFYGSVLGTSIQEAEMGDVKMGIFPNEVGSVNVVLASGSDYKPGTEGSIIYLNAGADLQAVLDKIEPAGGKIIVPKTAISAEMGFFALFIDSEGNRMGLHSDH